MPFFDLKTKIAEKNQTFWFVLLTAIFYIRGCATFLQFNIFS